MSDSGRRTELLLRWEDLRQRGKELTPEELCSDNPHLLDNIRQAIDTLKRQVDFCDLGSTQRLDTVEMPSQSPMGDTHIDINAPFGPYEIVRELGRGGIGLVFQARDKRSNRDVAMKMIQTDIGASPEKLRLLRREAEAISRLQHPNIVRVFEIAECNGHPYLTLELVPGGNLADFLCHSPISPQKAARICEPLAKAIHAAHEKGVIHRDLKPSNVLLAADGTPKIADFGLAKFVGHESLADSNGIKGTPCYMAPEQTLQDNSKVSCQTDVYALGAILYACLTGRPPHRGATAYETLALVRGQNPIPPRRFRPSLPREIEAICMKCLNKEARRRYASALELAEDLGRFLNHEPAQTRPYGSAIIFWNWRCRNPLNAALALIAAGLSLALMVMMILAFA